MNSIMRKKILLLAFIFSCTLVFSTFVETIYLPPEIRNAYRDAPEGVYVGIGSAKEKSDWESMSAAQDYAHVEIAHQIDSFVHDMVTEYAENNSQTMEERTTQFMSSAQIRDSRIVHLFKDNDGTWYCVMYALKSQQTR